ncbi:kinesin-like protein KIF14 [Diabrotica virgifera virgifera]|uniref:Kinesin-like protein n=1 Tax=Diabrotica virgifera virgifera TaxID=50390 RepID=A0A6P7GR79_DIAVI|nr:kinesin-like protein KIF14 [Diabrotica virgifera virgifera]
MAFSTPSSTRKRVISSVIFDKTPKSSYATPKNKKVEALPTTPECFNNVQVETPVIKRRTSKDKFDEVSNLTVAVRIRPMNARELVVVGATDVVLVKEKELIIKAQSNTSGMSSNHQFHYDHIFWSCDESNDSYASQEDVFRTLGRPLINSAFKGYNGCLFAYGQTGSGKSFSMMGKDMCEATDMDCQVFSGITPRFCKDIFNRIAQLDKNSICTVEVSYFEIYNEKIHDLLSCSSTANKQPLKVREHPELGPYVVDLSVQVVKSYKELRHWLLVGNRNRATAATTMNEKSSRSHSIFSIELCLSDDKNGESASRKSRISLVDLAGSERLGNSHGAEGRIREGVCINKSLLTLGKVISALADQKKNQFVPYRESVLTWLLKESLGGNSLTTMLATISPSSTHLDETLATLRYACQARSIVNRARVNENPHDRLIRELRSEVERLRALRQDFERSSLSSSSLTSCNDAHDEELEGLRKKLSDSEKHLEDAQKNWEKRFLETKKTQLKELAEAEKYKAELESKVRVMKRVDDNVKLSPYRTNFLEELECVLTDETDVVVDNIMLDVLTDWCCRNGLTCTFSSDTLIIKDPVKNRHTHILINSIDMNGHENVSDFVDSLTWTNTKNSTKKISKNEVMSSMNQIYQALATLQPPESENNLCLLFAKVNKTLQSFEAALLNNAKSNVGQKVVTFDADI